jgi:hypothetical protein
MNCRVLIPSAQRLRISDIKREFVGFLDDMSEEVVLDSIDQPDGESGFRIQSHDALGVLPEIFVQETGNRYEVLDRLDTEIARLVGTVHTRRDSTIPATAPVFGVANAGGASLRAKAGRLTMLIEKRFASQH